MARPNVDSFTAYLEEKQRLKAAKQTAQPGSSTPLDMLQVLAKAPNQQMAVGELQSACGMSFTGFAESLRALQDSRYVALSGAPGSEVALLTPLGVEVAGLARPR